MTYLIYDKKGNIIRKVDCSPSLKNLQVYGNEFILKSTANDVTQKVIFDGLDEQGQPVNPRVADKTQKEIEASKPPKPAVIPEEQKPAQITQGQYQDILDRIEKLESTN